jgi:hypothetical protein
MKKLIGLFVICGLLSYSGSAFAAFSDIRSGSQLETYIDVLVEKGIISGYPDGSFQPERTINRAEALKIIFETIEGQLEEATNSGFPDVPESEWFAKYVTTAKKKDIVRGYPDGKFRPTQEVNRAEFIKMVMSALPFFDATPKDSSSATQQYSDVYDLWYTPYVSAGLQLGFLNKTGELKPTAPMQRQDAVEIVYRISKYLEENPSALSLSDIPYVPEESFSVVDPTKTYYNNSEVGPDKFMVKKDIGKTEIFQKAHGYNLVVPEIVGAWSFDNAPNETVFETTDGCRTYLGLRNKNRTIEEAYKEITSPTSYMTPYKETKLEKLTQYEGINAYLIQVIWTNKTWNTHVVELPTGILQVITDYTRKECVQNHPPMILGGMSLR